MRLCCVRKRNHYARLSISFTEPVRNSQSVKCTSLQMVGQLSTEDFTGFVYSLRSTTERTASVYHASDHVGFVFCAKQPEDHTRMLIAISLFQNSSSDVFEVLELSLAVYRH